MSHKILHVCKLDKFIPPFVDFVEENFSLNDHFFWSNGGNDQYLIKQACSNYKVKRTKVGLIKGLVKLVFLMHGSKKIILHGLFNPKVVVILFLMPWLLKKCYWVIWGGDLYVYQIGEKNLKWKVRELIRRPVIKNMGHLITYIPGDVELARQWYGAKGKYHECLMYLSNVIDPITIQSAHEGAEEHTGLNILVGNSADPSNNHLESLEKLLPYINDVTKIFVPLSYGDQEHAKKVIEKGKAWFGGKFVPLTSFMGYEEYLKLLKSIDIAVFNHKRQQAMGNIITLLGMGKKIYMQPRMSHYEFLKSLNLDIFDINDLELKKIRKEESLANSEISTFYFSEKNLINQFSCIFGG